MQIKSKKTKFMRLQTRYMLIFLLLLLVNSIISTLVLFFVEVHIVKEPLNEFHKVMTTAFLIRLNIIMFIIGSIFILIATKVVMKPLIAISTSIQKVSQGDLTVSIPLKGIWQNEISELTQNLNIMIHELSRNEYLHKDFVSNVSHEFKTPLCAIHGYTELLQEKDICEEKRTEYINTIQKQVDRLSKLSSDLLRLSELENQSIMFQTSTFSLDEQIRDAVILLQTEWEHKNIEVTLDLEPISYTADKSLLYQVWVNLIGNAIKFTNDGGNIFITLQQTDQLKVSIADTGIGMNLEETEKAFDRFYTADTSRTNSGTGLGLSISKKIIQLHGGSITVTSEVHIGSLFEVIL